MKKRKLSKYQMYLAINSLVLSWATLALSLLITKYDILPIKYLIPILSIEILIPVLLIFFMMKKNIKNKIKTILSIISIIITILYAVLSVYIKKTYNFIEEIIDDGYVIENYSVITLKNSNYNELKDLESKNIGYYRSESPAVDEVLGKIKEEINFSSKEFNDQTKLIENLYNERIEGIIIEEDEQDSIEEEDQKKEESKKEEKNESKTDEIIIEKGKFAEDLDKNKNTSNDIQNYNNYNDDYYPYKKP